MATHDSPDGHPVEVVEGKAGDIQERGQQVINLGAAMSDAAGLLTRLVNGGADMEGKSVDKLREVSEEVYKELGRAASLYESVGPYIKAYGDTLATVKTQMKTIVPDAETKWLRYQAALDEWQDAQRRPTAYPSGTSPSDDGSAREEAEREHDNAVAEAEGDKDAAYRLWKEAGDAFDEQYDLWKAAFDDAVRLIRSENSDGIEDSWRDNLDGFVDFALDVLAVAGVVLAVLALVVGGPLVALAAVLVGVLTLAGTLWQYSRGDASLLEVGIAVLGVIPFGALGEFASGGFRAGMRAWGGFSAGGLSLGDDLARWSLSAGSRSPGQWINNMRTLGPEAGFVSNSFDEVLSSVMTGQDPAMWEVVGELATTGQQATYAVAAVGTHYNNIATLVGGVPGAWNLLSRDW